MCSLQRCCTKGDVFSPGHRRPVYYPDYLVNPQPSRLAPGKKLIFVLTQGNPDEKLFADVFPRNEMFLKWLGFIDIRLVRACGIGPATVDEVPAAVLQQAEETARELLA